MQINQLSETDAPLAYDILSASKKAGLGRSKLFEEINAGRLKARKAGRRTLILRDDLAAWLASLPQRGRVAA